VWATPNWTKSIDQLIIDGHYERAIVHLDQLQKKYNPLSKDDLQIQILKAGALKALGRHIQAKNILLPHLKIIDKYTPEISVRFYNTLGSLHAYLSQTSKASQFYHKALQISKQSGQVILYCETLNEIGLLYYAHMDKLHHYHAAIDAFNQALKNVSPLKKNGFHAQLKINLARVYVIKNDKNHTKEALQSLKEAKEYVFKFPDTFRKGCLLLDIARLYEIMAMNNKKNRKDCIRKAHHIYVENEKLNKKINDHRLAAGIYFQIGHLYEDTKQFEDAITLTQKSIFYAQQTNDSYVLYQNNWQLGRLNRKIGKIQKAIKYYNKAIKHLAPIRQQIYHRDLTKQNIFDRNIKPAYLELSEIYFNLADSTPPKSEKYDHYIHKAWHTMDEVKSAELEDIFDDPCVSYQKDNNLQLNSKLGSAAVIYFIPFSKQPGLIILLPNGFKHLRLSIDTKKFNQKIYRLRKDIPEWGIFEEDASELYQLIISPLYNDLKKQKVTTLVVASDGAMRLLPFSIFFSPEEQFLLEEFEIVTIPALHLTRLGETNRKSPNGLFCGITQAHTIDGLKFEALPRISKELDTITKIVPGDIFMDEAFTVSNLESKITEKKYSVVHLATHGEFGSIPEKTFLLTHDDKLTMNSLEKLINKSQSSSIDILTLSACQTAIGDERAAFGLAGGAVKAGAKCAIATLWSVDDYASQKIISDFYRNVYQNNYSKAKAMQQAQLALIEKIQFWHPAVWSAFLVIGNWY
jgi:CHAT domain-containing protein